MWKMNTSKKRGGKRAAKTLRLDRKGCEDRLLYSERTAEPHKALFLYQLAAVEWKKHR